MIRYFSTIIKKPPITITNNAWNKVNEILKNTNSKGMIFYATSGGCNGFNYKFDIIKEDEEIDNGYSLIEANNSKVYIDPKSEFYLLGTTIDYQT
jgi:iron-sulfur cluster assembly accessory protein